MSTTARVQKRIAFFVHDGVGLGHLQRISKIVQALQGLFSCLVITGSRAAAWLVPAKAEFIHLPSFESMFKSRARKLGRYPFVFIEVEDAVRFRQGLITAALLHFDPDAIVVDYRPLGDHDELEPILRSSRARKYLILRGVLDTPSRTREKFLEGAARLAMEAYYDKILVAADRKICDVAVEYDLPRRIAAKLTYVGYVSAPLKAEDISKIRGERIRDNTPWVVCSVGGGRTTSHIVTACKRLPVDVPEATFDLVYGPNGPLEEWQGGAAESFMNGNVRYFRECKCLPALHNSADVVVTHGGYNSLVEAMEGGAHIISCYAPPPDDPDGFIEEWLHPNRLCAFYPLRLVTDVEQLRPALVETLAARKRAARPHITGLLDFTGTGTIRNLLIGDLAVESEYVRRVSAHARDLASGRRESLPPYRSGGALPE